MTAGPQLPSAYRLVALDEVDSTNDEAKRLVEAGAEEGTLVWARAQRRGRGRRGQNWVSPPGNLYFSLVLRPECPPLQAAQLSFVAALALADGLGAFVRPPSEIAFKWPNDVLLNRRKVAGILLESSTTTSERLDWLVLGAGVNIVSAPAETVFPATSLRAEGCGPVTAGDVLEAFSRHYLAWSDRWREDGFAPIRKAWLHRVTGVGERVTVNLESEKWFGKFANLDGVGALVVELPGGERRTVSAGDVFFGPQS